MIAHRILLVGAGCLASVTVSAAAELPISMDTRGNPIPATATSFDCRKARGFAETSICSDVTLAITDRSIAETYQRLLLHAPPDRRQIVRREQRDWLRSRNSCSQRSCLEASLGAREHALGTELDSVDRHLRADVSQVGRCAMTRIDFIGPRLERVAAEPPQGTSVGYADGVWQVSYDREPEVLKSHVGDPVRVCLVSKPHNCPPGDDRGRLYSVWNLRTHANWKLPDASHRCGGA
jgi:uncharacterized protein YecT (DUF1311 family)